MTRAGSKLVLRTSPAPGHYLYIKWDFASLHLRASRRHAAGLTEACLTSAGGRRHASIQRRNVGSGVQRLVAKTVYVNRETALVVGSDNVLLGIFTARGARVRTCRKKRLNGVLSQCFVSQFGKIDGHI